MCERFGVVVAAPVLYLVSAQGVDVAELPTGTVTFLFTDLVGSTRLWQEFPEAMKVALARHDEIVGEAIVGDGGYVVKTMGDGFHAVFSVAQDAIDAAVAAQVGLGREAWGATGPLVARMGIHSGPADVRDGDYFGTAVNRAARLMGAAHGGQIVVSRATEELVRDTLAGGVGLVDLGEHVLRDVARPERVFQVTQMDLVGEFPPLRSFDRTASELPAALTSFVGRERELTALISVLRDARMVTLVGVGGVGKTRLALEAAAELAGEFGHGVVFCELASVTDRRAVPDAVASRLRVQPIPGVPIVESIVATLRDQQRLVVLDNCEHVLDAAGVLADAIVRSCPRVTVLATSREGLGIDAEVLRPIRSLSVPDDSASVEEVAGSESAQLFAVRAAAVRPEFVVDAASGPAVGDICRQLDGVPLALELAAARVSSLTVRDIAERLDQRFRLLTGGHRTALERHQTLRNTVDWSYELLDPAEAWLFDRLSVFAGGFTLDAAESVVRGEGIDAEDVLDLVSHLVARSMVIADESGDVMRYRLLETMRQYARERLDAVGDPEAWRRRHADYYLALADRAEVGGQGPEELRWVGIVEADLANFRAVLDWSVITGHADDALRLCLSLAPFVWWRPTMSIMGWFAVALDIPGSQDGALRAHVTAWDAWHSGFGAGGLAKFRERLAVMEQAYRDARIPLDIPALQAASSFAAQEGRYEDALQLLDTAIERAGASDAFNRVYLLGQRAMYLATIGRTNEAVDTAEEAVVTASETGSVGRRTAADAALGYTLATIDPKRAIACLRRSRASRPETGFSLAGNIGSGDRCLARLLAATGDLSAALAIYAEQLELWKTDLDHFQVVLTCESLAVDLSRTEHHEVAAVLIGALEAAEGDYQGNPIIGRSSAIEVLRQRLGDDRLQALTDRGRAMRPHEMLAYARTQTDRLLLEQQDQ